MEKRSAKFRKIYKKNDKKFIKLYKYFLNLKNIELTVLLTNTKKIKKLNLKYRKKNRDTDIFYIKKNFIKEKLIKKFI